MQRGVVVLLAAFGLCSILVLGTHCTQRSEHGRQSGQTSHATPREPTRAATQAAAVALPVSAGGPNNTAHGAGSTQCRYSEASRSVTNRNDVDMQEYAQLRAEMTAGFTSTRGFIAAGLALMVSVLVLLLKAVLDVKKEEGPDKPLLLSALALGTMLILLTALSEIVTRFLRIIFRQGSYLRVFFEEEIATDGNVCVRTRHWLSTTRPFASIARTDGVPDEVVQSLGSATSIVAAEVDAVVIEGGSIVLLGAVGLSLALLSSQGSQGPIDTRLSSRPWVLSLGILVAVIATICMASEWVVQWARPWLLFAAPFSLLTCALYDPRVSNRVYVPVVMNFGLCLACVLSIAFNLAPTLPVNMGNVENLFRCFRDTETRRAASDSADVDWESDWCMENCRVPQPPRQCPSQPDSGHGGDTPRMQ